MVGEHITFRFYVQLMLNLQDSRRFFFFPSIPLIYLLSLFILVKLIPFSLSLSVIIWVCLFLFFKPSYFALSNTSSTILYVQAYYQTMAKNPKSEDPIPYVSYWHDCDKIEPFASQDSQVLAAQSSMS
jgi:hypothetical protein